MYEFLSNNGAYMLLIECMNWDWSWLAPLIALDIVNIVLYFVVFSLALSRYRAMKDKSQNAKSFLSLAAVFAACAVTGYAVDIVGLFVPHYRLKVLLLVVLVPTTAWLVYRISSGHLLDAIFKMDNELAEKWEKQK